MIEYSKTCIRASEDMRRSPEVLRLMRVLKISMPEAVGIVVCLVWLMLEHAEKEDVFKWSDVSVIPVLTCWDASDIADGIGWRGDPDMLLNALHEARIVYTEDECLAMPKLDDYKLQDGC